MASRIPFKISALKKPLIDLLIKRLELHPHEARVTVEHLIRSEQYGKSSHGLIRISYLITSGKFGPYKGIVSPKLKRISSGQLRVNGAGQLGYSVMHELINKGLEEARRHGTCVATGRSVYPSGCLGDWADIACEKGVAVFLAAGSPPRVAPLGGMSPIVGTNAICFGTPAKPFPLISDCATSEITHGMLLLRQKSGQALPPRSAVGPDGNPTDDATKVDPVIGRGALLPFGGSHKAFALGMAIELLASLGGNIPGDPDVGAHGVFALFLGPKVISKSSNIFSRWLSSLDQSGTRIPGWVSRRKAKNQRKDGIVEIPEETVETLSHFLSPELMNKALVKEQATTRSSV